MTPPASSLGSFVLRVLLWLPLCLAAWYFIAQPHSRLVGELSRLPLHLFHSEMVSGLEQTGRNLEFVTTLEVYPAPGQVGVLVPEVNPLLYTYGLAFFIALMLASQASWSASVLGAFLLLPYQCWGVTFDILAQVSIKLGPDIAAQVGVLPWQAEVIALGYQIGTLIMPTLTPVILWATFNRTFIQNLLQKH